MSLDLDSVRFEPLASRPSKVTLEHLGRPALAAATFTDWLDGLPDQLGAKDMRGLRDAIVAAHGRGRPVLAAMGGHVIKTGCAPYLIDLAERGVIRGFALNGSAAIHDLELALAGHTSEDVGPRLADGTFGFARETADVFAAACQAAAEQRCGLGAALSAIVAARGGPGENSSLLVAAHRRECPLTVHVAIGTDIVHMNPALDGAALGVAALDDFRKLTEMISGLAGGVWLNLGSAVVMPEVFLKAVALVRNLGIGLEGMTTANLDFQQQYRGRLNVLQRPGGQGFALTGQHEILIPLLHAAILDRATDRPPAQAHARVIPAHHLPT